MSREKIETLHSSIGHLRSLINRANNSTIVTYYENANTPIGSSTLKEITAMTMYANDEFSRNVYKALTIINSDSCISTLERDGEYESSDILTLFVFCRFQSIPCAMYDHINSCTRPFIDLNKEHFVSCTCNILKSSNMTEDDKKAMDNGAVFLLHTMSTQLDENDPMRINPIVPLLSLFLIYQCKLFSILRSGLFYRIQLGICSPRIIKLIAFLLIFELQTLITLTSDLHIHSKSFMRDILISIVHTSLKSKKILPSFDILNSCNIKAKTFVSNFKITTKQKKNDILYNAHTVCSLAAEKNNEILGEVCSKEIASLGYGYLFKKFRQNYDPDEALITFLKDCNFC